MTREDTSNVTEDKVVWRGREQGSQGGRTRYMVALRTVHVVWCGETMKSIGGEDCGQEWAGVSIAELELLTAVHKESTKK